MSRVHHLELEDIQSVGSSVNEAQSNESRKLKDNREDLSHKIRAILWLMKLFGEYYGNISMHEGMQSHSIFFSRFYCGMVLMGQWFLFVQASTSLFFEGLSEMKTFYFLLIFTIWYLQCAAFTTICLFNLPKRQAKSSRFRQFFDSLLSTSSDFSGKITHKVYLALALACTFAFFNTVLLLMLDFYENVSVARFRPWNGLTTFRFIQLTFSAFGALTWGLACTLLYVSCEFLVRIFDSLEKKISTRSPNVSDIRSLRLEHGKLCETVSLADKVFSPLILLTVILDVPLMCINFHQLVRSPFSSKESIIFIVNISYWCIGLTVKLAFVMWSGIKVNEKVSGASSWHEDFVSFFFGAEKNSHLNVEGRTEIRYCARLQIKRSSG